MHKKILHLDKVNKPPVTCIVNKQTNTESRARLQLIGRSTRDDDNINMLFQVKLGNTACTLMQQRSPQTTQILYKDKPLATNILLQFEVLLFRLQINVAADIYREMTMTFARVKPTQYFLQHWSIILFPRRHLPPFYKILFSWACHNAVQYNPALREITNSYDPSNKFQHVVVQKRNFLVANVIRLLPLNLFSCTCVLLIRQ